MGQGQALYEVDQPQQSYEWSQSGLEFLQQVKEKKYIPEKALMKKKFTLYELMHYSLFKMPSTPANQEQSE